MISGVIYDDNIYLDIATTDERIVEQFHLLLRPEEEKNTGKILPVSIGYEDKDEQLVIARAIDIEKSRLQEVSQKIQQELKLYNNQDIPITLAGSISKAGEQHTAIIKGSSIYIDVNEINKEKSPRKHVLHYHIFQYLLDDYPDKEQLTADIKKSTTYYADQVGESTAYSPRYKEIPGNHPNYNQINLDL